MTPYLVTDLNGRPLASFSMGDVPSDVMVLGLRGEHVVDWVANGCPTLRGEENGGISDVPDVVSPSDPLWGLAFLEALDEFGWEVSEARAAEYVEELHPRDEAGKWTDSSGSEKKKKAPKAAPVPLESKQSAYADVKAGGTFKKTAEKYGMTQGQLSGYVWKVDQAKKKVEEGLEEELAAKSIVKAEDIKTGPSWTEMTPDEKLSYATEKGYVWKEKANSTHGNHAWFDAEGNQVSGFGPKEDYRAHLDTINYGHGIVPKVPDVPPAPGEWPLAPTTERSLPTSFRNEMNNVNGPWSKSLTASESDAISAYTASGYSGLNASLRTDTALSSHQASINKNLNSAIAKAPAPPPPDIVWRGISSSKAAALFAGLKNGDQLTLKGFQSSSISPAFAHSWASGSKMLFEIKPSKGAFVRSHSNHPHEDEYLIPHGRKFTVRGVSNVKIQGVSGPVRVLQLEMH